jgi:hypothetical protein
MIGAVKFKTVDQVDDNIISRMAGSGPIGIC